MLLVKFFAVIVLATTCMANHPSFCRYMTFLFEIFIKNHINGSSIGKLIPPGYINSNVSLANGCTSENYFVGACDGDWHTAFAACALHGMELVVIDSSTKQRDVEKAISSCKPKVGLNNGFWIGAYRVGDKWTWLTTGKETQFTKWGPGQPQGGKKRCVEVYKEAKSKSYFWNDLDCDEKYVNKRYVCQNKGCVCNY